MTMKEIMCGKEPTFPGLIPLCYAYLEHIGCDPTSFARIHQYLQFIKRRACGELMTDAAWIRKFCQEHPEYKKDSVVTPGMCYDLVKACDEIGTGQRRCPEVLGNVVIEPIRKDAAFGIPLDSSAGGSTEGLAALLRKIASRASAKDGPQSAPSVPMKERRRRAASSLAGQTAAKKRKRSLASGSSMVSAAARA
jgi:glutamate--cysteine ligase catalytic subunit